MSTMPPHPAHINILRPVSLMFFEIRGSIRSLSTILCVVRPRTAMQRHPIKTLRKCRVMIVFDMSVM
jgi:hypothetical protein